MAKRSYSDREKAEALAILDSNGGNVAKTARETGVPATTITDWRDGTHVVPEVSEIRDEKKATLLEKWQLVANISLDLLTANNGTRMAELNGDQVARVAGIATDKIASLRAEEGGADDDDEEEFENELRPEQVAAWAKLLRAGTA